MEYVALALKHKPLNLGQGELALRLRESSVGDIILHISGFPDYPPPDYVTKSLSDVANGNHLLNQVSSM